MTWRFQPVYREHHGERFYTLCEVYLETDGALHYWTEQPDISAIGDTIAELIEDLQNMMSDAALWKPVPFDDLHVGMTFERQNGGRSSDSADQSGDSNGTV